MEKITFQKIEKHVMSYIILHRSNLCNFTSIYNDFLSDIFNISFDELTNIQLLKIDPHVFKLLKIRLGTVIMYLDSNQNNVSVIKSQNSYLVGYGIDDDCQDERDKSNDIKTEFPSEQEIFEHIIDDDVSYHNNLPTCNGDTLLHYGTRYNDISRIEKVINKYNLSFYTKNNNNLTPLDMIGNNHRIYKLVLYEHYNNNLRLKDEVQFLNLKTDALKNEVYKLKDEVYKLTNQNKYINLIQNVMLMFNILYILIIFIIVRFHPRVPVTI